MHAFREFSVYFPEFLLLFHFWKVGLYLHGYELPNTVEEVVTFASIYILFLNYMHNSWKFQVHENQPCFLFWWRKIDVDVVGKNQEENHQRWFYASEHPLMVAALGKTNLNSEFKILPPTCFEMHQIKINLKCATNGLCSLYLHKQSAYTRCTLCPQHICSKLWLQRQKQLQIHQDVLHFPKILCRPFFLNYAKHICQVLSPTATDI